MVKVMLGFKAFWSAAITIAGSEIMHMIGKGQLRSTGKLCPAQQFYSLAVASLFRLLDRIQLVAKLATEPKFGTSTETTSRLRVASSPVCSRSPRDMTRFDYLC
jgi:hypothetical protein